MSTKIIMVMGSARVQEDDAIYEECYQIGRLLARSGYIVMSGGYSGVMEAVSRGAAEADGSVHGITVERLEHIGESLLNRWVGKEFRYSTLRERMNHLIERADGYIIMPGGIGTLQLFVEIWQGMRLGDIPEQPLFVYAPFWDSILQHLLDSAYVDKHDVDFIINVRSAKEITDALEAWFAEA